MPGITRRCRSCRACPPEGFSLTELLVASAIALIIMAAVASLFSVFSGALAQGETTVEMIGRLRGVAWQLRQDLTGVTVSLEPWTPAEANAGYFELVEGPLRDSGAGHGSSQLAADTDDALLFTTRSAGGPFIGRFGNDATIESGTAEVIWFCRRAANQLTQTPGVTLYNLYRRQLLVVDAVGKSPFLEAGNRLVGMSRADAQAIYDISLREDPINVGTLLPNTLADLSSRHNRFGHPPQRMYPNSLVLAADYRLPMAATFDETDRAWEDVMLTNVIGFDVRVFDPGARAQPGGSMTRYPGDPGYAGTAAGATGAFVDLGWGGAAPLARGTAFPPPNTTAFQSPGFQGGNSMAPVRVYDTWSLEYEFNGLDEDADGSVDEGTNGVDDNGNGTVDEPAEFETTPPYPVPLRAVEVRIRCYEPTSRQIRQITVRHSFD